jgi:pyridoxamine 5'-phosphate oxidase
MSNQGPEFVRREYGRGELREEDLLPDPIAQFARWFQDAMSAGLVDPNAMSLATATPAGETTIRTVLLKGYSDEGFVFFTNLESTKAKQIASNPNVSLLFPWLPLERQVIINGTAARLSLAEVTRYFLSRPRESRIAAWVSPQSRIIEARKVLEMKFHELAQKFSQGEVPLPSFWGGFRVAPRTIEFWQGGKHRLHDRFLYTKTGAAWTRARLAP